MLGFKNILEKLCLKLTLLQEHYRREINLAAPRRGPIIVLDGCVSIDGESTTETREVSVDRRHGCSMSAGRHSKPAATSKPSPSTLSQLTG